jgi:type II secretory pathway pseudopilin PulG
MTGGNNRNQGFTLIELISIILLVGIISVVATAKWPGDMKEEAAAKEFKRALRYAQHQAMTREFLDPTLNPDTAWGIRIVGNQYFIQRHDSSDNASNDFLNRNLLGDTAIILVGPGGDLWFNGLGEPINPTTGQPLTIADARTFTINGTPAVTVCPETGYVMEGATCP